MTGTGPGLATQDTADRVFGRFWSQTKLFFQSKPRPLAGYPDPLLILHFTNYMGLQGAGWHCENVPLHSSYLRAPCKSLLSIYTELQDDVWCCKTLSLRSLYLHREITCPLTDYTHHFKSRRCMWLLTMHRAFCPSPASRLVGIFVIMCVPPTLYSTLNTSTPMAVGAYLTCTNF